MLLPIDVNAERLQLAVYAEGADDCGECENLFFPFTVEDLDKAISNVEYLSDELWHMWNDVTFCVPAGILEHYECEDLAALNDYVHKNFNDLIELTYMDNEILYTVYPVSSDGEKEINLAFPFTDAHFETVMSNPGEYISE